MVILKLPDEIEKLRKGNRIVAEILGELPLGEDALELVADEPGGPTDTADATDPSGTDAADGGDTSDTADASGDAGAFALTRLVITHCVIDAQPASVPVVRERSSNVSGLPPGPSEAERTLTVPLPATRGRANGATLFAASVPPSASRISRAATTASAAASRPSPS